MLRQGSARRGEEDGMRRLGKVLHVTHNGYIVVEMEQRKPPRLNVPVYTGDRRRVGVLLDVIGPVTRPYAVVKPDRAGLELPRGEVLYYRVPRPPRRPARGRRGGGGGRRSARRNR